MNKDYETTREGYDSGHPWYYFLGGRRLRLKEIRQSGIDNGYRGYNADEIDKIDQMLKPTRSERLRALRSNAKQELKRDIARYRQLGRELCKRRAEGLDNIDDGICDDVHTNICLKHNHMYNQFAHIAVIDDLLSQQRDLFDF